jgi:hypothetical protein
MDVNVQQVIKDALGDNKDADLVIKLAEEEEKKSAIKLPHHTPESKNTYKEKTVGNWRMGYDGTRNIDARPDDSLTYPVIDDMMKTGVIRFALDMKRAQMTMPFRNSQAIKVECAAEEEFGQAVEIQMQKILDQMMFEASHSALVYGSAFLEVPYEILTPYQLGLTENKDNKTMYSLPKVPNMVPHETISGILRKKDGSFNGFIQNTEYAYWVLSQADNEITVPPNASLVIPYNGYSRNLWGESFLKPIWSLWYWYENILRAAVQFVQMMGDPPRIGKAPSRKKVRMGNGTDLVDAIDWMLAISANLPKTNSLVIPSDLDENGKPEWELAYLTMPDRSQPFVQIIELFGTLILRAALTGDRTTTQPSGDAGSRAIGEVHAEATALHNDMVIANWLHYINRHLMPVISKLNYGAEAPPLTLKLQTLDPREREFLESLMGIAGNSASFQEFFYRANWEEIGRMAGLPMLTEEQAKELKETLNKEALDKQEKAMEIQQKAQVDPKAAPEGTSFGGKKDEQKKVDEKVKELVYSDDVPIILSFEELFDMFPNDQKVELFNKYHDKAGRFASKSKAVVTTIGKEAVTSHKAISKKAIGGAIGGGISGGIAGALKGAAEGTGVKEGLSKGIITGAKRGAIRAIASGIISEAASHAGKYGWAVQLIGGTSMYAAGRKQNFGLDPKDFSKLGIAIAVEGATATLEAKVYKTGWPKFVMFLVEFLESTQKTVGVRSNDDLSLMGFKKVDEYWSMDRKKAAKLLEDILLYFSKKKVSMEAISLFNPFHDKAGRFASKKSGGSAAPIVQEVSKRFKGGLVSHTVVEATNWKDAKKYSGISDRNYLGAFNASKQTITVSPAMKRFSKEQRDKVVVHESIHARKRAGGGTLRVKSSAHVALEEGCTDLMAYGFSKTRVPSSYVNEMASVATMARRASGNNKKKAWEVVSAMHYHNDTDKGLSSFFKLGGNFTGGSVDDINWMLSQAPPTKLEIDTENEFVLAFKQSEEVIYNTIRKIETEDFEMPVEEEDILAEVV